MTREILTSVSGPDSPFNIEEIAEKIELTAFGPMTVASVVCGKKVTNGDLIEAFRENFGNDTEEIERAQKLLDATGITVRHASWDITPEHSQLVERTAQIGAKLVRTLMKEQGWESIDCLLDTSASLPAQMGKLVLERAELDPKTIRSKPYRVACAGAAAAFIDALREPELDGKRVIVCALEPLSQHVSLNQCTLDDSALSLPTIFGDDFAAIAFNTADFQAVSPRTHIIYDGAPIRFYSDYNLPPTDKSSIPSHYSFGDKGEEISSVSEEGFFLRIEEPENGMPSQMNGMGTYRFFVPHTIAIIKEVVESAYAQGIAVEQVVMHQPSKKVNEGFQHQASKVESLKNLKIPDFLLGEIERSNSSSATALVIWQYLAKQGRLRPAESFLICAPGIGSAISAAVIVPKAV